MKKTLYTSFLGFASAIIKFCSNVETIRQLSSMILLPIARRHRIELCTLFAIPVAQNSSKAEREQSAEKAKETF